MTYTILIYTNHKTSLNIKKYSLFRSISKLQRWPSSSGGGSSSLLLVLLFPAETMYDFHLSPWHNENEKNKKRPPYVCNQLVLFFDQRKNVTAGYFVNDYDTNLWRLPLIFFTEICSYISYRPIPTHHCNFHHPGEHKQAWASTEAHHSHCQFPVRCSQTWVWGSLLHMQIFRHLTNQQGSLVRWGYVILLQFLAGTTANCVAPSGSADHSQHWHLYCIPDCAVHSCTIRVPKQDEPHSSPLYSVLNVINGYKEQLHIVNNEF